MIIQNIYGGIMKDKLCLIPYSEIEFDKTYTNISEYFLRGNRAVGLLLSNGGADERMVSGRCSDYELLSAFLKICGEKGRERAAVVQAFKRVVFELIGEKDFAYVGAEELWMRTAEALYEKKLRERIADSSVKKIGIPVLLGEYFDEHFVSVKGKKLVPVFCPFGTENVSLDTLNEKSSVEEIGNLVEDQMTESDSCALFLSGFAFEKPNEYSAMKAYEKHLAGQTLLNKERDILYSQLFRIAALSAAKAGKELMIFLPFAPDVASMGAAAELVDYMDCCLSDEKLNVTVFGGDAVSICMAEAIASKRYKNITAVTGICGNGSDRPDISSAVYWGCGESSLQNYASLAKTPALINQ